MGLFSSSSETETEQYIDPKDITSAFGSIDADRQGMDLILSPEQQQQLNLFADVTTSQLQNFLDFDQAGFEQSTLDLLRQRAEQAEAMQGQEAISNLFNRGILGRNVGIDGVAGGGFIQPEIMQLQEAQARADLDRQLLALGLGQEQAAGMLGLAQVGQAGQQNIAGLFNPLLQASLAGANQFGKSTTTTTPSLASQIASIGAGMMTGGLGSALGAGLGGLSSGLGQAIAGSGGSLFGGLQNYIAAPIAAQGGGLFGVPGSWAGPQL